MRKRKTVLVAPVLPFRGGIAQHSTMMHRNLINKHEHYTESFMRLYPAFLYPGTNDVDPSHAEHLEAGVKYKIDTLNPYTWTRCIKRILEFQPDSVIFPWWHIYFFFCFGYMAYALKRKGVEIVFMCHNASDHDSSPWRSILTRWLFKSADRIVVHTREDSEKIKDFCLKARVDVHPHPIYDQFPQPLNKLQKRTDLELLFYGYVRPYKGLDSLIDALAEIKREVTLTIAGEFWDDLEYYKERVKSLGLNDRVEIRPHYHSDAETATLFERADVVVLPYRSATGSGIVPLAYHYGKPVVATRVGGFPDVIVEGRTGWLVEPDNHSELAEVIEQLSRNRTLECAPHILKMKSRMSWTSLAELVSTHSA